MINQRRLTRIETSLSPKQAVLFWLRQEHQGKTSSEYLRWMLQRPASEAPRNRVELQVIDAIRAAMKGRETNQIYQAVRQGQMYADFLIVLVSRTNRVILDDSRCRALYIALLYQELRYAALSGDDDELMKEWAGRLRDFAQELFSLRRATELIRDTYFDGECILFKDATEELEQQIRAVRGMVDSYNRVLMDMNRPRSAINSANLDKAVTELASKRATLIVALAKSTMLDDFGETQASKAIANRYILESQ